MFGDDLEAILDVLEDDERIQNDFTAAVSLFESLQSTKQQLCKSGGLLLSES